MEYRKTYFRIHSRYQFDSSCPDESDATEFREETRRRSRVRAGICIPTETVHLIPSRKASRIYTCTR